MTCVLFPPERLSSVALFSGVSDQLLVHVKSERGALCSQIEGQVKIRAEDAPLATVTVDDKCVSIARKDFVVSALLCSLRN